MNVESGTFRPIGTGKVKDLADEYLARQKMIKDEERRCYEIQVEIKEYMDSVGATELNVEGLKIKLETRTEYQKEMLTPLLEYEEIPPDVLDNAMTPERIIPPSWNMTKVKPFRKYSKRCADLSTVLRFRVSRCSKYLSNGTIRTITNKDGDVW